MPTTDILILGAGAAGLCCATACARQGRHVLVLDAGPKAARKVLASGGGRCNCTNLAVTAADYRCANPHFVKSALARFPPAELRQWLREGGVATVEEAGGKVFCRDGARALVHFLLEEVRRAGARLVLGTTVATARKEETRFVVDTTDGGRFEATTLVLALGGLSWPTLGATDAGYRLAKGFGLELTALRPGLTPLLAGPETAGLCRTLAGVSLPVRLRGPCTIDGELLFTHKGLSGPAVLDASLFWRSGQRLEIDWLPGNDLDALLATSGKQAVKNVLAHHLPKRLALALCQRQGLDTTVAELSAAKRRELAATVSAFPFTPARAAGYAKAEVTCGGVETAAVSSKTFEVANLPGLFIIGELLDVTGRLGGFNLHWAFASGFAAGQWAAAAFPDGPRSCSA